MPSKMRKVGSTPRSRAELEWLCDFIRNAKGEPQLTSWEANFVAGIQRQLDGPDPHPLSAKQAEIVKRIDAKLNGECPDDEPEDAEPSDI